MQKVRTIFIGTAEFGIPSLEALLELEFIDLVCVITQPDKPVGRKQELKASSIKEWLIENCTYLNGIWQSKKEIDIQNSSRSLGLQNQNYEEHDIVIEGLEQPERIKSESSNVLENYKPDLIIVAAYGQIIPDNMLEYPKYSCLNLHGSILPKLRGAVPVHMAILQDFKTTGVSLQRMVSKMDAGAVITTLEIPIEKDTTTEVLLAKLAKLAKQIVVNDLVKWVNGELKEKAQDDSRATFCYMSDIAKENAEIKSSTPVLLAERMIRAFYPWPVAWVRLSNGKVLKVYKARIANDETSITTSYRDSKPKVKIFREGKSLWLKLSDGALLLDEVQLEGKKRAPASEYLFLAN